MRVLLVAALAVALCSLGLLRLNVETDPQRLWVGARSQALAEKRHFEVNFLGDIWDCPLSITMLCCHLLWTHGGGT